MRTKSEIRRAIRGLKQVATEKDLSEASERIADKIATTTAFAEASVVLSYTPLPDEPDLQPLLQRFYREKTILLPTIVDGDIVLREYEGEANMKRGKFNILEPVGPVFSDYVKIDLAIIPGVAFDALGHRLGRGGGYYDRLLSHPAFTSVIKMGVCFSFQMVDDIPTEAHDIMMNNVISD